MRGIFAGRSGAGGVALAASLLLPGCDLSFDFTAKSGNTTVQGRSSSAARASRLVLLPAPADRLPAVLPGGELVLPFSVALDPAGAREAVRVVDEGRGGAPVPVEVSVRKGEMVLRPVAGAGWRPGGTLLVRVAGLPSLRALRSGEGDALAADAERRFTVRHPRRADRRPPRLEGSEPAAGVTGVDPAAPVVLRFSEPLDPRALNFQSTGSPWEALRLEADGRNLPFRSFLDRSRREVTLLAAGGLPAGAEVEVLLTDRVRDVAGNRLDPDSPRRFSFSTAGHAGRAGLVVEAFEDSGGADPLGTTVRWNDRAAPGVLAGVLEPGSIATGAGDGEGVVRLDPRGGVLRVLLPAAELGEEPRALLGLHLLPAPGGGAVEMLDARVRLLALTSLEPWEEANAEDTRWQVVADARGRSGSRGPAEGIAFAFRHPFHHDGSSAAVLELSWSSTSGSVLLRAGRQEDVRAQVGGPDPERTPLRAAPLLRLDALGDRPVALSRWMDAGVASPSWGDPIPQPAPGPGRAVVRLQGAPAAEDGGPDFGRATAWTEEPGALEGMRWIRFRVLFPEAAPGEAPAAIDRLDLPFVAR